MSDRMTGPLRGILAAANAGLHSTDKSLLLAMLSFADYETWELWPTVATLARRSGLTERTVGLRLNHLEAVNAVRFIRRSRGGISRGSRSGISHHLRLDIDALERMANPEGDSGYSGAKPRISRSSTPNLAPEYPEGDSDKQTIEQTKEQTTTDGGGGCDLFTLYRIEHLRGHRNATPDRLDWIEREAPTKKDPGCWAAACIRGGWAIPAGAAAAVEGERRRAWLEVTDEAKRKAWVAELHAERAAGRVAERVTFGEWAYQKYGPGSAARRVAVGESIGDGCEIATYGVHSRHGSTDEGDSGGGEGERRNALRDRQGRGRGP